MTDDGRSDAKILTAARLDPTEFAHLVTRHYRRVYRLIVRRIGVDDAEDVVQETFLTAFRILNRFDTDKESALPWLYGIATNAVGDWMRQQKRHQRIYLALAPDPPSDSHESAVVRRVDAARTGALFNKILSRMPERDREPFLLHALTDLSYPEIGEALGAPSGTIGSRIARVRRQVRELIPDFEQISEWMDPELEGDQDD